MFSFEFFCFGLCLSYKNKNIKIKQHLQNTHNNQNIIYIKGGTNTNIEQQQH